MEPGHRPLIPVVGKVRQTAQTSACASNLRQIGVALATYSADNRNGLPGYDPVTDQYNTSYGLNRAAGAIFYTQGGKPTRDLCSHLGRYLSVEVGGLSVGQGLIPPFVCPANPNAASRTAPGTSYYIATSVRMNDGTLRRAIGYNNATVAAEKRSVKRTDISNPSTAVALFDADNDFLTLLSIANVTDASTNAVHGSIRNVLYFDGHVSAVPYTTNPQEKAL